MNNNHYALKTGALIILIYLLQLAIPSLTDQLAFQTTQFSDTPWKILTSIFAHSPGDYMHLLNNLFFLTIFGTILEHYIGSRKFLILFLATGLLANLSAFTFYPDSRVLGASGAISGIIAFLAVIKPRRVGLFWGAPVPMWLALIGWVVINLAGIGSSAGIAYESHLYGLASGVFGGLLYRKRHTSQEEQRKELEMDETVLRQWEKRYMEGQN